MSTISVRTSPDGPPLAVISVTTFAGAMSATVRPPEPTLARSWSSQVASVAFM
jgi:hypothetical protein